MNSMSTKQSRNKLASHSSHQRRLQSKHWRKVRHSSALAFSFGQDTGQHIRYHFVEQNSCREHRILATSDPLTVSASITAPLQFDQPVFLAGSLSIRARHSEIPVTHSRPNVTTAIF